MNDDIKNLFVVVTHSLFVKNGEDLYGTGSVLEDYLKDKKVNFLYIKQSLKGKFPSVLNSNIGNEYKHEIINSSNSDFLPLKAFKEFLILLKVVARNHIKVYIGIDPLNAAYGLLLKRFRKIDKVIFYTADYSEERYDNKIVNGIYHLIDKFAYTYADEVWNVSRKIVSLRKRQGVPNARNKWVPNTPAFEKIKRLDYGKINKHEIVIVSTISASIALQLIFEVIRDLSNKYPDVKLKVIGITDWNKEFKLPLEQLSILNNVIFMQSMPHEELLKELCKSAIGFALYTNVTSWTKYCDSMKARDYLACGLPVIITKEPPTAKDIQLDNAGYIVELNKNEIAAVVDDLFMNENKYVLMRNNAIALAKKRDVTKILEKLLP